MNLSSRKRSGGLIVLGFSLLTPFIASAVTVNYKTMSRTPGPTPFACIVPESTAAFLTSDAGAHLWFGGTDVKAGDRVAVEWYNPQGLRYSSDPYPSSDVAPSDWTEYCAHYEFSIAGQPAASMPGIWTAKVLWNGSELFTLTFSIMALESTPVLLFEARNVSGDSWLGPQRHTYVDGNGMEHAYHVFAVSGDVNINGLQIFVHPEGSGSAVSILVPSGGQPDDKDSGGALEFRLPFGLEVTKITGGNAEFGSQTKSSDQQFWDCQKAVLIDQVLDLISGGWYQPLQCFANLLPASAGDRCAVVQPIINAGSAACLAEDSADSSLLNERALNTHQVRRLKWKPVRDGGDVSQIMFHLTQSVAQTLTLFWQKGIALYVTTAHGDYLLDKFK